MDFIFQSVSVHDFPGIGGAEKRELTMASTSALVCVDWPKSPRLPRAYDGCRRPSYGSGDFPFAAMSKDLVIRPLMRHHSAHDPRSLLNPMQNFESLNLSMASPIAID
jgi:hypothetical protein